MRRDRPDTDRARQATDVAGNSSNASYTIHVRGAGEQVAVLIDLVEAINSHKAKKFEHPLDKVEDALAEGDLDAACRELGKVVRDAEKSSGKWLTEAEAEAIATAANRIRDVLGCAS